MVTAPQLPKKGHRELDHKFLFISFPVILQNHILPNRVLNKPAAAGVLAAMRDVTTFQNSVFWSSLRWRVITSQKHWRHVNTMYWWLIQALYVESLISFCMCSVYPWEQICLFKKKNCWCCMNSELEWTFKSA